MIAQKLESRDFSSHLRHHEKDDTAIVFLQGDLGELGAFTEMKARLNEIPAQAETIILHLGGLTHINTIAVGGIVAAKVRADKDGKRFCLCCLPEKIRSILEMSGILHLVPMFASLEEARACAPQSL